MEVMQAQPNDAPLFEMKVREHAEMAARAVSDETMWEFLKSAPPQLRYETVAAAMYAKTNTPLRAVKTTGHKESDYGFR